MARTDKVRTVKAIPTKIEFITVGENPYKLKKIKLTVDEFEAIRLADFEGKSHEEAAKLMNVSRPTFSRIVEKGRKKVSEFIVEGKKLVIEGGNFEVLNENKKEAAVSTAAYKAKY